MSNLDLKTRRKEAGLTQQQLAIELGVDRRTIINYEKGDSIPESKSKLIDIILSKNVKPVQGIGSEINSLGVNDSTEQLSNKNGNVFELKGGKFRIYVKKVPVKAFGSYLSDYQDPDFFEELEDVSFTVDHFAKGRYICFEVQCDSMDGGSINDAPEGAELLCRELGRQHWKDGFRNSIYGWVIVHKDTVIYKDIAEFNIDSGDIVCRSRSGLPQHRDFIINLNEVRQIWKVIKRAY
ncbi:helix-turn-helix domain-containing protein [uncultured Flavobacterium sp.]|uniref:helix-turn-helix domain-containing protein n=1 Tax=uncultured Flavobacterium sp. TaxID=165435 RepID=UPI0025FE2C01|nr:helix-turn-helix domain-containing protein [uncultured Flavobacterium sp.]